MMNKTEYLNPTHDGPMMSWVLNQRCNFTCDYCFYTKNYLSKEHPDCGRYSPGHITDCFDRTNKQWWIYMNGGEPFLYPDFIDLCNQLTQNHYISINTNLSTSNCLEFAERINPKNVYSIEASLHISEREKRTGLAKYLKYFLNFHDKGFPIQVVYVTYPELLDRIEEDIKMLKGEGIQFINLKIFRGYFKSKFYPKAYSNEERELIARFALDKNEIDIMEKSHSFFGKSCKAGYDFFVMDAAGDVRRCSSSVKSYGNFFENSFTYDNSPRPCPFLICGCPIEGINRTSKKRNSLFSISKEFFREGPDYFIKKARPSKIIKYIKKRYDIGQ